MHGSEIPRCHAPLSEYDDARPGMKAALPAMRMVLDTNTVMALWHFEDPALERLRQAIEQNAVIMLTRHDALEELRLVLGYRQFMITERRQAALFGDYRRRCLLLAETRQEDASALPDCRDHDDQKFLEIARDGAATHLLSRDKALLKLNRHRLIRPLYRILTPEAWCRETLPHP